MEEDIKLQSVDKIINDIKEYGYIDAHLGYMDDYQIDSILHYLKRYKELEEENKELKNNYINPSKARISYYDTKKGTEIVIEGFIPKSLVKEKIEELEKEINEEHNAGDFTKIFEHEQDLQLCINVLQELLREE